MLKKVRDLTFEDILYTEAAIERGDILEDSLLYIPATILSAYMMISFCYVNKIHTSFECKDTFERYMNIARRQLKKKYLDMEVEVEVRNEKKVRDLTYGDMKRLESTIDDYSNTDHEFYKVPHVLICGYIHYQNASMRIDISENDVEYSFNTIFMEKVVEQLKNKYLDMEVEVPDEN